MSQDILQKFILQELTRYKREGHTVEDPFEQIKKWIGPTMFMHFANINKLGINPQYKWSFTPAGVYGYPLNEPGYETLVNDGFIYASDFKYLILFSLTTTEQVYDFSEDISDEDLEAKKRIVRGFSNFYYERKTVSGFQDTNIKKLYAFVNESTLSPFQKRKAFMACGINGFVDRGQSFLTNDIEAQAVIFNPRIISQEFIMRNPLLKTKLHNAIVDDNRSLSSETIKNLPQNIVDKILLDPHASSFEKEAAIPHASLNALLKLTTPDAYWRYKDSAFEAIAKKYPQKIIPFLDSNDDEIRLSAYRYVHKSVLDKRLVQLLQKEKNVSALAILADRVSESLLDEFLPYLEKFKKDYSFGRLYSELNFRRPGDGIFQAELSKYSKYR